MKKAAVISDKSFDLFSDEEFKNHFRGCRV